MSHQQDFFETPAGQTIAGAHRYINAAKVLRYSDAWGTLVQVPTLNLLAHGIELLLKFPLLMGGMSTKDVRKQFGHQLVDLWNDPRNAIIRRISLDRAEEVWEEAKASGKWIIDDFSKDPRSELKYAVEHLSYLHSADSDFALRYLITPNTYAPRPAFLIDVFVYVAERLTMDPMLLKGMEH